MIAKFKYKFDGYFLKKTYHEVIYPSRTENLLKYRVQFASPNTKDLFLPRFLEKQENKEGRGL